MKIFGLEITKASPKQLLEIENPEEVQPDLGTVEGLRVIVEHHIEDLATINTAINRIERKQNRWLDILNIKEKGDGEAAPAVTAVAAPGGGAVKQLRAGDSLDEYELRGVM